MRYEHTPRPLVEEHYHIRELIEVQSKRSSDRSMFRDRAKLAAEREDLIVDSKPFTLTDFWCEACKEDFKAQSIKEVEIDWTNTTQRIAFYRTKHLCGKWCMRLITDRNRDAFWFKSRAVRVDQALHYNDTLQPYQTGFNLLYGKKL